MPQNNKRLTLRRLLIFLAAAAGIVLFLDVGCIFRRITGIPCPGCGMTRAHLAALRLDFQAAFFYHPLWFLPVPLLALGVFFPKGIFRDSRWTTAVSVLLLVLVLGVYAVRMFRYFPDTPPMEYQPRNLLNWLFSLVRGFA